MEREAVAVQTMQTRDEPQPTAAALEDVDRRRLPEHLHRDEGTSKA